MSSAVANPTSTSRSHASGRASVSDLDPFWQFLVPPDNETPQEKAARLASEAKAKQLSDEIDEALRKEGQDLVSRKVKGHPCVRVLLLGQSESGKSTLQRQFTLLHSPKTFDAERPSWRLVIFLNVVRSIQRILKVLGAGLDNDADTDESSDAPLSPTVPGASQNRPQSHQSRSPAKYVAEMTLRLSPITSLEEAIVTKLIGPEERQNQLSSTSSNALKSSLTGVLEGADREFFMRPETGWRSGKTGGLLDKLRRGVKGSGATGSTSDLTSVDSGESPASQSFNDKSDPGKMFQLCVADMVGLWRDPWVRGRLAKLRVRLEEGPGFFLDDLDRIADPRYMPTDDDILRARIKTIGISEYIFPQDIQGVEWRLYDVGGARTQRHAWVPYFEKVDAIIFLAPLSPFDQALPEDRKINCLEDSLLLFKMLCTNKLLAKVPLVLFLNKSDLLRKKLADGVQVSRYVVSYGDRPNTYEAVEEYFTGKFDAIKRQYSPKSRSVFTHVTSCVDQKTTASIIAHVQDILLRESLKESSLM